MPTSFDTDMTYVATPEDADLAAAIAASLADSGSAGTSYMSPTIAALEVVFRKIEDAAPPSDLKNALAELVVLLSVNAAPAILWASRKCLEAAVAALHTCYFGVAPAPRATLSSMVSAVSPRIKDDIRSAMDSMRVVREFGNIATHESAADNFASDEVELVLVSLKQIVNHALNCMAETGAGGAAAAAGGSASTSMTDGGSALDDLTCAICLSLMDDPRTTVCGHSFCADCLAEAVSTLGPSCPACRADIGTTLPAANIALKAVIENIQSLPQVARATTIASLSSVAPTARGPAEVRPGDWSCSSCGNHNFAFRDACRLCGAAKGPGAGTPVAAAAGSRGPPPQLTAQPASAAVGSSAAGVAARPGDWNCPSGCGLQFASRSVCRDCGTAKPTAPSPSTSFAASAATSTPTGGRPGDWNCPRGCGLQFASRSVCRDCNTAKPSGPPPTATTSFAPAPAAPSGGRAGDWNCPRGCGLQFASRSVCRDCNTAKPTSAATAPAPTSSFSAAPAGRKSDWKCPNGCYGMQFGSRANCRDCGHARPY